MRKLKKGIALTLMLCILLSLLPPMQLAQAADVIRRYELDTDGIDAGATYLIVSTDSAGTGYVLRRNSISFTRQSVTIQTDENGVRYISPGFTNESTCTYQFSASASGKITQDGYALDLANSRFTTGNPSQTLTFTNVGSGAYRISYTTSSWWSSTYYLRYNNSNWSRSATSSSVYLYKLVEYELGYDVRFDGNGYTSGTLPQDAESLDSGTEYTIPAPQSELRKDIGEDTWLFLCWNTQPDGSGDEYAPGDVVTVTQDLTLYANWYPQTKYTVTMITDLDGVRTDVDVISGQNKTFYVLLEGGDGTFIPLNKTAEGTYSAKVVENGDYIVYAHIGDGVYEPVHGHKVTIYNQDGQTECQHFTVSYDTAGGLWAEGEDPGVGIYHAIEDVPITAKTPVREGYRFLGWKCQDGDTHTPGEHILGIHKKMVLTAQWEKTVSVRVNVTIDHMPSSGGMDMADGRDELTFQVMRTDENGYNHPVGTIHLEKENSGEYIYTYDAANQTAHYTLPEGMWTFADLQKGNYTVSVVKSHYDASIRSTTDSDGNATIDIVLQYTPGTFDLQFDVVVDDWTNVPEHLRPQAVNIKIGCWAYDDDGNIGWRTITQQDGANPPVTVTIDPATGKGSGFYPVWQYWASDDGIDHPYCYRIRVSSYVMPDGSIQPAAEEAFTVYTAGIYTGTVTIEPSGTGPDYPDGAEEQTDLPGTKYDASTGKQDSTPTLTVAVTPFTVTFDAADGTISGQQQLVMENQYRYPDLSQYIPVPNAADRVFTCWCDQAGNPVTNQAGQMLSGNMTYYARYSEDITLTGQVQVATTYEQDGQIVQIHKIDRPDEIVILVRKQVGELFVTVTSQTVSITYENNAPFGIGEYRIEKLPNDGTVYQVQALPVNYRDLYDNDLDGSFAEDEELVIVDPLTAGAELNIRLEFSPELYYQGVRVDATQIAEGMRPTGALTQLLYRDLGDIHNYQVIADHTIAPYGIQMQLDNLGFGYGSDQVWVRHTDGMYYEYQLQVYKLYGSVEGAYTEEGVQYTLNSPYTVVYGPPANYLSQTENGEGTLVATLVPNKYQVILDLNLGDDTETPIHGLDRYMVDDGTGNVRYAYTHTWSYGDVFTAFPYRDGYVFKGWAETEYEELAIDGGTVYVGAALDHNVTLTAQWEKLTGTDYSIRYLELNTDKVLHGAQSVSGAVAGDVVVANDVVIPIRGYEYAGAMVAGTYLDKTVNPYLTISTDPLENLLVIYYLPDETSGYTEQIESNMTAGKTAVLENNGTYTITMDTYTTDNPITTKISQDTPMDVVLVLDQSGSMYTSGALDDLQESVDTFVSLLADHGREHEVDHRLAVVGYASDEWGGYTNASYPTAGRDGSRWVNTGVFDSHGEFHIYPVTGFNYTQYTGEVTATGTYYTYVHGEYLLLTYHEEYRHLITEEAAREVALKGEKVYGYVDGFVQLTRNSSGLWLYGDKKLYSHQEFFTYHIDVWTHREGLEAREIHAYGTGADYREVGEHTGVYTRTETRDENPQQSVYRDALVPVSVGALGSGQVTPGLRKLTGNIGGNGKTYVSYGMEMANRIFEENPLDEKDDRIRFIVVFTDGKPGDSSNFDESESNRAIELAYDSYHTYGADVYTIGLYGNYGVAPESDQDFFMNGLSSNYPEAKCLDDVWQGVTYDITQSGYRLDNGGPYFAEVDGKYYELSRKVVFENRVYYTHWGYTDDSGTWVDVSVTPVADGHPVITEGMVNGHYIYRRYGNGYQQTPNSGYYVVSEDAASLKQHFANVVKELTTKVTTEISLQKDSILRDYMNQGLVLTDGTVITACLQEGNYDPDTGTIIWQVDENGDPVLVEQISLALSDGQTTATAPDSGVTINVYNLDAENPTNPNKENYLPHQVDVTGYNYAEWFINENKHKGYKMVVTITRIEATDDVQWGRSTTTNLPKSGVWLPEDQLGERELLLPFDQPSTIFVERAYVLDYGKEFTLSGWYFDDDQDKTADPIHLDCNIQNGMNWFDPEDPNTQNSKTGTYGNTAYGNVKLENGQVSYTPTTMNWGGYDQFFVFGNTWRQTVLAQDANENGNLWNKVTVIPANNIYYEDSFVTTESETQNGIEGFTFTGQWEVISGENAGQNTEVPEQNESAPNGNVHGWTDSLGDDDAFTDDSAHGTGLNGEMGASAEFTFTGTGVDVYTRTNLRSGMVVAVLSRVSDGGTQVVKSIAVDNLAASGDYYHIPTVSFEKLIYGTYTVKLIATAASTGTSGTRYEYYIDGIRVYNPLGSTTNYQASVVTDAYGLETNAVFTEVRDVLLDYGDFNTGIPDDTEGKLGAVFIDWVQPGQEGEGDQPGQELPDVTGQPTYNLGTFETYGPKNEVYLSAGQAIVLRVDEANTYFVGLKSLKGGTVTAHLSGLTQADPVEITVSHTTDMYYQVTPVDGYIVIQNAGTDGGILSITKLRTTNLTAPAENGGILPLTQQEAVTLVEKFARYMANLPQQDPEETPDTPEQIYPSAQEQANANRQIANALFAAVRQWLAEKEGV